MFEERKKNLAKNRLLSSREARAYLNVGRDALLALIRSGKIRALRLGRGYRIPLSELEAFVQRELAQLGSGERA